jgi:hypothetical protein
MSWKELNWEKGLFRLWFVFTTIWVLCGGIATIYFAHEYLTLVNYEKTISASKEKIDKILKERETSSKVGQPHKSGRYMSEEELLAMPNDKNKQMGGKGTKKGRWVDVEENERGNPYTQLCDEDLLAILNEGQYFRLLKVLPRKEQKEILSIAIHDFRNLSSEKQNKMLDALTYGSNRNREIMTVLIVVTVFPPILLFLIGYASLWAFRGFRPK